MAPGRIRAVFFDVGETIVDESRLWGIWADCLGVSRLTFFALLGAVIARREHHRRVFELVKPNYDFEKARRDRERGNWPPDVLAADDLYPDALDCLAALKTRGYLVGSRRQSADGRGSDLERSQNPRRHRRVIGTVGRRETVASVLRANRS